MSRRRKIVTIIAGSLLALLLVLAVAGVFVARSRWFHEMVRNRIVRELEDATGGRAELGSFSFDWRNLKAEVRDLVLHGTEPAGSPPLLRARSVTVGLKIVSLLKKAVDIDLLAVEQPQAHLILFPDGRTNVPEPKIKHPSNRTPMETVLDLAIHRFSIENGLLEVVSRGNTKQTPWNARGENLRVHFFYEMLTPRYRGDISIRPLQARVGKNTPVPIDVDASLGLEKDRVEVAGLKLTTRESRVELSGAITHLSAPQGAFQLNSQLGLDELGRILGLSSRQSGQINVSASASFDAQMHYSASGDLHASRVALRQDTFGLRDVSADMHFAATPEKVDVTGVRLSAVAGTYASPRSSREQEHFQLNGVIHDVAMQGQNLDVNGIMLSTLGGSFAGRAQLRNMDRYRLEGKLNNFDIRRVMAVVSRQPAPWNGIVSGPVLAQGSLKRAQDMQATARLNISPVRGSAPVRGAITVNYDARRGVLDVGNSYIALPNTRLAFSGAIGTQMRVHFESRNLDDLLPVLSMGASAPAKPLPVKLQRTGGLAVFDGTISGTMSSPQITGHLAVTNFMVQQQPFDALNADVAANQSGARVENASVTRGRLVAQFAASAALRKWKAEDSGAVTASASIRGADVTQILAMAGQKDLPIRGSLTTTAQVSGTIGDPRATVNVDIVKGAAYEEPFDRLQARIEYSSRLVNLPFAQLTAGPARVDLKASFEHAPGEFQAGRVLFQVASNEMAVEQFHNVRKANPGVKGMLRLQAAGSGMLSKAGFHMGDLHADVLAHGLELEKKPVGDLHLVANTKGAILTAHLESNFAGSAISGNGEWRLAPDYPGTFQLTFSNLDIGTLRRSFAPPKTPRDFDFDGSTEGKIMVEGPMGKPDLLRASLEIPRLEVTPRPGPDLQPRRGPLTVRNSGPIRITMDRSLVKIESLILVARSTKVAVTGGLNVKQKNALDIRVATDVDLELVREFNPDIYSSGKLVANASIRGALSQPSINGQVDLKGANFNMADLPNGLSNANGTIVFNGNRATIQSLTGETGGGKVALGGFLVFGGSDLIFRVQATATQVRVRYPEGVSTVANADLNLTGTAQRSTLAGTITILRTGFNPRSDFSSLLSKTAQPVQTPSATTGLAGGMHFDIAIETAPDISFQAAMAQGLQAEANLRLRGTVSNPALLGRVSITQGELVFFGNKYTINQGSISFYNPVKIEPVLNIDLETKSRGVDITITVSGPISKLDITPRSDPPLQFSEILALLATGRAPTSDPTLAARQQAAPSQTWQQMGASALVGQAIANPVAGRLQRFFGVSKLKIDPTFSGVEGNPQARLTLEQQVSPDVTFTYITNVGGTRGNPQIVRVEWALSRQWSVIALREENGFFGMDFLYKKRFK